MGKSNKNKKVSVKENPYEGQNRIQDVRNNLVYANNDNIIRNFLPLPLNTSSVLNKTFTGGNRFDKDSFTPAQLKVLYNTAIAANKRTGRTAGGTEYEDYELVTDPSTYQHIQDLKNSRVNPVTGAFYGATEPAYNIASTIGRYSYGYDPNTKEVSVSDIYNFTNEHTKKAGENYMKGRSDPYGMIRRSLYYQDRNQTDQEAEPFRTNFIINPSDTVSYRNRPSTGLRSSDMLQAGFQKYGGSVENNNWLDQYKKGGMIKRADGSYSQRGLWDNIRANAGSGKKPTKEMLKQEKKIRAAEKKEYGGWLNEYQYGGGTIPFEEYYKHVPKYKNDTSGYDLRGYYNDNPKGAWEFANSEYGHAPDTYKKPNHITFSNESKYSTPSNPGGRWVFENNQDVFYATPQNIKNAGGVDKLQKYFQEQEKGVKLILPKKKHGGYSTTGYKADSPDRNNPYNIIPSGRITMQNVPHPVMGIDNYGNAQYMVPGAEYQFPGETVFEVPAMKEGGIPQRYKNMGFTHVGQKKAGDGQHKWKVLAKKGDSYKVVQGGYRGMQDFKQHGSQERRDRFWDRMGGRDSAKAKDPFSPLYWHKRFGTWEYGGPVEMQDGGWLNKYQEGGNWKADTSANIEMPVLKGVSVSGFPNPGLYKQPSLLDVTRMTSAAGSLVPHPYINIPSRVVNSAIGLYDAYNEYQNNNKEKAAFDFVTSTLPWMKLPASTGLKGEKFFPKKVANYNKFVKNVDHLGTADDMGGTWLSKYK